MVSRADVRKYLPGLAGVFTGGHVRCGIDEIEEVMGGTGAFSGSWLGRADIEVTVQGYGIAIDDLAVERFCQSKR